MVLFLHGTCICRNKKNILHLRLVLVMKSLLFVAVIASVVGLAIQQGNQNPCMPFRRCTECITGAANCAWCRDENWKSQQGNKGRCDHFLNLKGKCTNLTNPMGKKFIPSGTDQALGPTVQVKPQGVELTLRRDQTVKFNVKVSPQKNYPVDLYYLMDLSNSMKNDLESLQKLAGNIASRIGNITSDYRLAFGAFVDKTVLPYVLYKDKPPCSGCDIAFSFKHILDFTDDGQVFKNGVQSQKVSASADAPEGGFDALMQVAVCEKELKWRPKEKARRLVVFLTDETSHMAGDGKLGGIVQPSDGLCHLDSKKTFSKGLVLDYPSVGYLRRKLLDNKIVPILAVVKERQEIYQNLAKEWMDVGATSGVLAGDSGNVVELIEKAYHEITSTIRLLDNSIDDLKVEYKIVKCRDGFGRECFNVATEEEVEFEVSVTALQCSAELKKQKSFKITIPGFQDITVKTKFICDCECEKPSLAIANSTHCTGNGTYACGSCYCNAGRYGDNCRCDSPTKTDLSSCRPGNDSTAPICSGQGACICGVCECYEKEPGKIISGTYCQCNNFQCYQSFGEICGGKTRGICECGECKCNKRWTGKSCGKVNCEPLMQNCVKNKIVCGGHGKCDCGECKCDIGYLKPDCYFCPTCPSQCVKDKDCVLCKVFGTGDMAACANCSINIVKLDELANATCTIEDSDKCRITFKYGDTLSKNVTVYVKSTRECPEEIIEKPNILAIVLGTIGGIVLAGLVALLVMKLMVSAYDKYEYHRFEKERTKTNWQQAQNPLYKQAKQKYENPVYAGQR